MNEISAMFGDRVVMIGGAAILFGLILVWDMEGESRAVKIENLKLFWIPISVLVLVLIYGYNYSQEAKDGALIFCIAAIPIWILGYFLKKWIRNRDKA
jgi:hypothetical protein